MYSERRQRTVLRGLAAGLLLAAGPVFAGVLPALAEALDKAFPGAEPLKRTVFLNDAQADRVRARTGEAPGSKLVSVYELRKDTQVSGYAYLDAQRVRTLPQTLLVSLDPEGRVVAVDVLAFTEPPEYMPRGGWYATFRGFTAEKPPELNRDVDAVTGATLTSRATTSAVRRVLALHDVLYGGDP